MKRLKDWLVWGPLSVLAVLVTPVLVVAWIIRVRRIERANTSRRS
jgi:hypothetical protein